MTNQAAHLPVYPEIAAPKEKTFLPLVQTQSEGPVAVVAGAAGFVGSHLCAALLKQGCAVIGLDNFVSGKRENLKAVESHPRFKLVPFDLKQELVLSTDRVDYVFHVAGLHSYLTNKSAQQELLLVNSAGTKNLLSLADKFKAKFLLASIRGKEFRPPTQSKLSQYWGTKKDQQRIRLNESKRFAENLTQQYYADRGLDARIVRLDCLYGPGMELDDTSPVSRLLKMFRENKPLPVPGDGTRPVSLTYIGDAVRGLVRAMFGQNSSGKVYILDHSPTVSMLNLALWLKKKKPLEIEYVADWEAENKQTPDESRAEKLEGKEVMVWEEGLTETIASWGKSYSQQTVSETKTGASLSPASRKPSRLENIVSFFRKKSGPVMTDHQLLNHKVRAETTPTGRRLRPVYLIGAGMLMLILLLPFIICGVQLFSLGRRMANLEQDLSQMNMKAINQKVPPYNRFFNRTQATWRFFYPYFQVFGLGQGVNQLYTLIDLSRQTTVLAENLSQSYTHVGQLINTVWQKENYDAVKLHRLLNDDLSQAVETTGMLQTGLDDIADAQLLGTLGLDDRIQPYYQKLPVLRSQIFMAQEFNQVLPALLGIKQKNTLLVLLQNNTELRPTGGFIGSFGLVTFDKGKLIDWQIYDVYDADGQLKGHVEPPESLKKYLGEANWYLRDSNWDPDFPATARRAEWFLDKEMGRTVGGTVAINLTTIQNLLAATGPVAVPDYQEMIDHSNLFERAEYYAEVNFFPGSTQKKDFLSSLANAVFLRLKELPAEKWPALGNELLRALDEKNILVSLTSQPAEEVLGRYGWNGAILSEPTLFINSRERLDQSDYLMVVDTNVGVNKADYFMRREAQLTNQWLKDGRWQHELRLKYTNQSSSEAWPGGRYKNYWRLYVSHANELTGIKTGTSLDQLTAVKSDEITRENVSGKNIFGYSFKVLPGESVYVVVNLEQTKTRAFTQDQYRLGLRWQKQSGAVWDKVLVEYSYPLFLVPEEISPAGKIGTQKTVFEGNLATDNEFYLRLQKTAGN